MNLTTMEIENTHLPQTVKRRNPLIASLLSLFIPGLGQIYNGQARKGGLIFALLLLFPLVFGFTRGFTFFNGMVTLLIIELSIRIYGVIDAIINARKQKEYVGKRYNTWYYHLLIATGMFVVLVVFDTSTMLGTQTYKIPTTANEPTIQIGDWIVCDNKAYDHKTPNYGDIIAFRSSLDGEIYSHRVVGLPNDKLCVKNNTLTINGKPCNTKYIGTAFCDDLEVLEFEEVLPNGHIHTIYISKIPSDSSIANMDTIYIPPNNYFLLGDNRDNALDSRYIGPVSSDNILGQLVYSYWGRSKNRINIDFRDK